MFEMVPRVLIRGMRCERRRCARNARKDVGSLHVLTWVRRTGSGRIDHGGGRAVRRSCGRPSAFLASIARQIEYHAWPHFDRVRGVSVAACIAVLARGFALPET